MQNWAQKDMVTKIQAVEKIEEVEGTVKVGTWKIVLELSEENGNTKDLVVRTSYLDA